MPAPQHAAPAAPAAPLPLAPSRPAPGTESSRRLFGPDGAGRPITLWGSSSMSSEGGDEATPLPIRIDEHLTVAAAPAEIHGFGVGATRSPHTLLMRGLDTPAISPVGPPAARSGSVQVTLEPGPPPQGPIRVPGDVDGLAGVLDGTSGTWHFHPDDPAQRVGAGTFTSALAELAAGSRQVLWMGKNNILDIDGVLDDTQRMWDAAAVGDTLVLGQWPTEHDPVGSPSGEALAAVNQEQRRRYGDHFLDLAALLTGPDGLGCAPLAPLQVLDQGTTQDALARQVVPPMLVAEDAIHLNGWGNLAVSWAIVRRMRELRWL